LSNYGDKGGNKMSASIALNLNTASSALTNPDALHDDVNVKHSAAIKNVNQLNIPNSPNSSIYVKRPERENAQAKQDPIRSTTPQKPQEVSGGNIFSRIFSSITKLFSQKSTKNDDALTTDKASFILKNETINDGKALQALDYLANKATTCIDPFPLLDIFPFMFDSPSCIGQEYRIEDFCSSLIKDIKGIDALLAFRKRILHSASLRLSAPHSAAFHYFINTLINKTDNRVTQDVGKPIKDKFSLALRTSSPATVKRIYAETIPQLKAIKAKMPPLKGPLTDEQIEKKCAEFLIKTLGNICIEHDFKHQEIIEKEILTEPEVSIFINYIDKASNEIRKQKDQIQRVNVGKYGKYVRRLQEDLASYPHKQQLETIL
jgi:hypothetical protein